MTRLLSVATAGCSTVSNGKDPNKEAHLQATLSSLDTLKNIIVLLAVGIGTNLCVNEIRPIAGCLPNATMSPCPNAKSNDFEHIVEVPKYLEEACEAAEEWEGGDGGARIEDENEEGGNQAGGIDGGEGKGDAGQTPWQGMACARFTTDISISLLACSLPLLP